MYALHIDQREKGNEKEELRRYTLSYFYKINGWKRGRNWK